MHNLYQISAGRDLLRWQRPEGVSYRHNQSQNITHDHPCNRKEATTYEASHIAYSALENVRPAKFRDDTWSYIPKRDDTFGGRWRYQVESGREDDNI
jgi:hypothetical protein